MVKQNLEEKFIFLEISGEKGNIETYREILNEAATFGIKRILLACIWDNKEEKGEELLKEVSEICLDLGIKPFSSVGGYKKALYTDAMIGIVRKTNNSVVPDITSMISLKEYKMENNKALDKSKDYMDKFMRKLENGELSHMEEPVDEKQLVTLNEKFIKEQVESFGQLLNDPLMKAVEQSIDKSQCLSLKNETTSNNTTD